MSNVKAFPGTFPLHEDRNFLAESEWVIFKLLCRPVDSFAEDDPESLSVATGSQVTPARCDELIRIVRINQLAGIGSWISRIFAQAGLNDSDIRELAAATITDRVNAKAGYKICNEATTRALAQLQLQWKGAEANG